MRLFVPEGYIIPEGLLFKCGWRKFICVSLYKKRTTISFILDNTYVVFADFVLRQDWGIPIGGNSSSEIASCTLGWCEFVYMRSLVKDKNGTWQNSFPGTVVMWMI